MVEERELAIVGGGPAGITAGLYAARSGLDVVLFEKGVAGGTATLTEHIENYPGFPGGISGPELGSRMAEQARSFGLEMRFAVVEGLQAADGYFLLRTARGDVAARSVILATGTRARSLGVTREREREFLGRGVSYCATCDGPLFQGCRVAVVGGGDAAVEEGLFLTRFAERMYLIHRRARLRATAVLQERARQKPKIEFLLDCVVEGILGAESVEAVRLRNVKTGEVRSLAVEGVFVFIGMNPNSELVRDWVSVDEQGYVLTNERMATAVPGLFAAGDVRKKELRQVVTAVADGAVAAAAAERYLASMAGHP